MIITGWGALVASFEPVRESLSMPLQGYCQSPCRVVGCRFPWAMVLIHALN